MKISPIKPIDCIQLFTKYDFLELCIGLSVSMTLHPQDTYLLAGFATTIVHITINAVLLAVSLIDERNSSDPECRPVRKPDSEKITEPPAQCSRDPDMRTGAGL